MNELLNILFAYDTRNTEDAPSSVILTCMEEVAKYLRADNVHAELQKYEVVSRSGEKIPRANLLAYRPDTKKKHILFQGHIDTVPFSGPYHFHINEKEIVGRGAVDMKGPLAGMIAAFKEVFFDGSLAYSPALLITGDEEANAFAGINYFLKTNHLPIAFAINGEPTGLNIATDFRGVSIYTMEIMGHAGHSSSPDKDKLIEKAAPLLAAIKRFLEEARKIKDDTFGGTIAAFTLINAGVKANQLPENLRIAFNLRTVEEGYRYDVLYRNIVEPCIPDGMKVEHLSFDPVRASVSGPYLDAFFAAFKKYDISSRAAPVNAFTEATLLNQHGIPTLDFGPGDMNLAHVRQEDERLRMDELNMYRDLLVEIVRHVH